MPASQFLWVTRSSPYAFLTGHRLRSAGHETLVKPVLAIEPRCYDPFTRPPDALVFTSTHGVTHHRFDPHNADIPIYAVGRRTAMAARDAGYREVFSADGNVTDLEALISARAARGAFVVHLGAAEPAGDLVRDLSRRGFTAEHVVVYESLDVPIGKLRPALAALPWIDGVLVHSPKAGRRLSRFMGDCGDLWRGTSFCISAAAAAPITAVTNSPVLIARFPTEKELIALVDLSQAERLPLMRND